MGEAVVSTLLELGARVDVLDIRDGSQEGAAYHAVNLCDQASIDRVVGKLIGDVDALVNCAGMPQTFPYRDVLACNVVGLRHLTESLIPKMHAGGAIANTSSIAGRKWRKALEQTSELLDTPDMTAALAWIDDHPDVGDPYIWSKMAVNAYTVRRGPQLAKLGIRMNAVCPGNTSTAMTREFVTAAGQDAMDILSKVAGAPAVPQQMADVLVFLVSGLSTYMNGALVDVDGGFGAAAETRQLMSL
jgi:NAD(P)-dependent dehydrogenase (short-subunit alcohol dehydrogenase family)